MKFPALFPGAFALLAVISSPAHAQDDPPSVPSDCFFLCKEQYAVLQGYGLHTPSALLKKHFGEPRQILKTQHHEVARYVGQSLELFVVRAPNDGPELGVAVRAKQKPAHARIPYIDMGGYQPETSKTNWYHTLADLPLRFLQESCPGRTSEVDARYQYVWSPNCYFGRPGRYKNYSFLFEVADCKYTYGGRDYIDAFDFNTLKCPAAKATPLIAFVTDSEDAPKRAAIISELVYWQNWRN